MKQSHISLVARFVIVAILIAVSLGAFPVATNAAARPVDSPQVTTPAWFNCTYVVRPGDDLYRIALRYGVSYWTLASANGIWNPNFIWVGMVLRVPCPVTPPPVVQPPPSNVCAIYFVRPGDWLSTIAARFGVTWQSIAALNNLANPNLIFVGMRLAIPCRGGTTERPIKIDSPQTQQAICSPVTVTGHVTSTPFEATLRGRVLSSSGALLGETGIHVTGEVGKPGTFSGKITFDPKTNLSGTVEVADISPKDGSVLSRDAVFVYFAVNPSGCS